MNNKLYFKYLLLLITLNNINVYSFNPRSNQIINFLVIRNVNTCPYNSELAIKIDLCKISTNLKLDSFNKKNIINIKLNKLLFFINNYTYS